MAERYFEAKVDEAERFLELARVSTNLSSDRPSWRRNAAFNLHQAVEASYACALLVHTFYFPRSHNIKFLRSLAEATDKALVDVWPRAERLERRRFELLKRAYVEARYSDQYDVSPDDLLWLRGCVERLREAVAMSSRARIAQLKREAEQN